MSYNVSIKKVTRELVKKNEYVGKGEEGANDSGYRNWEEEQDVERVVYTQVVSDDMVLTDVIEAVNKRDSK
ncbi:hypothetical protein UFOVP253_66 [uncultured Caudovirales phage]|uniref:Uncharacterized protein n=1 Tax=uncultured Caudovirales phage TaxID=2100421 RepID=A0A6J5LEY0_9CAUD|nr:hypothetical protein UFOVP253_66 [uncultured Caudovirales phage]